MFIAMLMLMSISCCKNEASEPDFHQTYTMQCQKSHLEDGVKVIDLTEIVEVKLSYVNSVITVSFTIDNESCLYTYTSGNYEIYTDEFSVWSDTTSGIFKKNTAQVGNSFTHTNPNGYTLTLTDRY